MAAYHASQNPFLEEIKVYKFFKYSHNANAIYKMLHITHYMPNQQCATDNTDNMQFPN